MWILTSMDGNIEKVLAVDLRLGFSTMIHEYHNRVTYPS